MLKSEIRRAEFLSALYEASGGNPQQSVETVLLGKTIGMEEPELSQVVHYLKEEGLLDYFTFGTINITHKGRKTVEASMAETFRQKEDRVLNAIKDMSRMSRIIVFPDLVKRLGMSDQEVSVICNGFHDEGLVNFSGGDFVEMLSPGYRRLEQVEVSPAASNVINIGQNYGAAAIGTNINQSVTTEFTEAINRLHQLVQTLDIEDKEEALDNVDAINTLAARDPTPSRLDKIKLAISGIQTTLIGVGALEKAKPLLDGIWKYINAKYHLTE